MTLKIHYYDTDTTYIDLAPITESLDWGGEIEQIFRKAVVNIQNSQNMRDLHVKISLGRLVIISIDNVEFMRGFVIDAGPDSSGKESVTIVDNNWYLTKNDDMRIFKRRRADQIIRETCQNFQIPVGTLANTGYVLPKMAWPDGASLRDIFIQAITETRRRNGRAFAITSTKGKLNLIERSKQVTEWNLEDGVTLTEASIRRSIENTYTQVRTYGDLENGRVTGLARNADLIRKYGLMQKIESYSEENPSQSAVNALAKERLRELSETEVQMQVTSVVGKTTAISGTSIYVYNKLTGIIGGYYIVSDGHTFDENGHSMTLTLSKTDKLPEMDYTPPEEAK